MPDELTGGSNWDGLFQRSRIEPLQRPLPRLLIVRLGRAFLAVMVLYLAATAVRVYVRKYYVFLPGYVRWALSPTASGLGPTHVFFVFADHFEPDYDAAWTREWAARYAALASKHHDADGRVPQHTWFYPGEQYEDDVLGELQKLMLSGYGEVELHFHHSADTAESLKVSLGAAIEYFQHYGFLKTVDGRTHFAFVHGNFGLDNANGDAMCGVNGEIALLRALGCFADFSFPSVYVDSQPPTVNSVFAVKDDQTPKSYRRALPLSSLTTGEADLMMFEGPLVFAPTLNLRRLFLDLDDGNLHASMPAAPERVDRWIRAQVHVPERPDWIFVKVFAHGASSTADREAVLGPAFDDTLTYLEQAYNDGRNYVLHYVTAREAYNVAMAASDGAKGQPGEYLDTPIPPYIASARPLTSSVKAVVSEPGDSRGPSAMGATGAIHHNGAP